jgi:hypothetical protein
VSAPPIIGPSEEPIPEAAPQIPMARPWVRGGKASTISASELGPVIAAPMPTTATLAISHPVS